MPETLVVAPAAVKYGNPGPLGLAAFGVTTLVLSAVNAGLMPPETVPVIVPLAFAYGGVAQILAGIFEFKVGNTFGMVAFTSYGLFWWWFALLKWTVGAGWLKAPPASAVALTLAVWGLFTLGMWLISFWTSKAVWSIFLLLWVTFFLLAAGDAGYPALGHLGGYVGLLTGADALVVAMLEVLNATAGRVVVSLGRPIAGNVV